MKFTDIDWENIWQDTMGWNNVDADGRKFNDAVERDFWIKLAPRYTKEYNLNNDTDLIAARLAEILGSGKKILEIGCGSGNFTVLMAKYSKEILGLDFSQAMLNELHKRLTQEDIENVRLQNGKWEDFETEEKFDYVVSVNSLYRICDMPAALAKINQYGEKGFVIIRTIQRPFFFALYNKLGIACDECVDYQLLPMMLWQQGLHANVEFLNYSKSKLFNNAQEVMNEMRNDLGEKKFIVYRQMLEASVKTTGKEIDGGMLFEMPRTTVIISVKKE